MENITEENFGQILSEATDFNVTAIKTLLTHKYGEDFGIFLITLDPGDRNLPFAAFPSGREDFVFSGKIMRGIGVADDYVPRTVFLTLENGIVACFAEDGLEAAVRVDTKCVSDATPQEKETAYPAYMKAHDYKDLFLRIILLNNTFSPEQLKAKMKDIVRRLEIDVDVSAYIYSFAGKEVFDRCKKEVFGKPRISNDDIEYYAPDGKVPIWIEKEVNHG